jgi:hypothetical protein
MPHDSKLLTRRELAEYLGKHGYPISLATLNRLCARDEGPPPSGIWGGQFQYDSARALSWARSRFRTSELPRGRRRTAA